MNFLYNSITDPFDEKLETDNLLLRPYEEGDEKDFMRVILENNAALSPAFSGRLARVQVLEDARIQVQQLRTDWDNRKVFDFGVWQKADDTYIGDITLKNFNHKIPKAEVGLYFANWPVTRAYAQEGLHAVLNFAFSTIKLNKLFVRCTASNQFYGELVQSCGFRQEGLLRNDHKEQENNELQDVSYYGMTREDFEQTREKAACTSSESIL